MKLSILNLNKTISLCGGLTALLIGMFLLLLPAGLLGQVNVSIEEYVQRKGEHPSEKVFLHLDRHDYMQGDTIWFKGYSWYGYDQTPDTLSRILHVDLVNPAGTVVLKRKVLIENGASQGYLPLDSAIVRGSYAIRAYTRWMQNPVAGEPFYKTITISPRNQDFQFECVPSILKEAGNDSLKISFRFFDINKSGGLDNSSHEVAYTLKIGDQPLHKGNVVAVNAKEQTVKIGLSGPGKDEPEAVFGVSVRHDSLTFEKQFRIPLRERIDIKFFPEGGKLVAGLESKVAFKTIGTDGLGKDVKGVIETGSGDSITNFESSHKGMGAFLLKPEAGRKYFAHLWYNNLMYIIPLPAASEEGCVMSVSFPSGGNDPYLTIKQKHYRADTTKYVIGSAYGKIWFSALVRMAKDSCRLRIPLELLPEGVSRLTVMNSDFEPECERLIYADKKERLKIEVKPDSSSYGKRSKVTLLIKAMGTDGAPVQTDLSLAVVDKELVTTDNESGGICAYKLLESELRGYIEDAGFYFKNDSCNHAALDLLLLTQGYRKFLPDTIAPGRLKFKPERWFDISGKITLDGSRSRERKFNYRDIGLTLICRGGNLHLDQSKPDSLGRFSFRAPLMYGSSSSMLQARTAKGKPFYGEIVIDEPESPSQFAMPGALFNDLTPPVLEYVSRLQTVKKSELLKNPWNSTMSFALKEVTVTAKAINHYRYQDFEEDALKSADLDILDPDGNRYRSVTELLIDEFGAMSGSSIDAKVLKKKFGDDMEPGSQSGFGAEMALLPCYVDGKSTYFPPIYILNGSIYWNGTGLDFSPLQSLGALKVNQVKKLMVFAPGGLAYSYAANEILFGKKIAQSLVVMETYHNPTYRGDPMGVKTFILEGLDAPRAFYSPRYDKESENPIYDGRTTLFWEPSVRTDAKGEAKAAFFTSDRKTVLEVVINGIEVGTGKPGEGRKEIIIKELKNERMKKSGEVISCHL